MRRMARIPRAALLPEPVPGAQTPELDDGAGRDLVNSPWLALGPPGTLELRRPRTWTVRCLEAGTRVCLVEDRLFARLRLARVVRLAGLVVEREVVAVPTARRPLVLVDDHETAVRQFWNSIATVPPGLAITALPAAGCLRMARLLPWRWTGALTPGRIVIGRMS